MTFPLYAVCANICFITCLSQSSVGCTPSNVPSLTAKQTFELLPSLSKRQSGLSYCPQWSQDFMVGIFHASLHLGMFLVTLQQISLYDPGCFLWSSWHLQYWHVPSCVSSVSPLPTVLLGVTGTGANCHCEPLCATCAMSVSQGALGQVNQAGIRPALQPPGDCPGTAKYIFPSTWLHHTSSEIPSCPLCSGWMTFSPFPSGLVLAGREERTALSHCPAACPDLPDKEQGAGKHQAGFLFRCSSWSRCHILDLSLERNIFEYCLQSNTWPCCSSLGALGNRHSCQYSFLFVLLVVKCEQTFGSVDVRGCIHVLCWSLYMQAQAAAIISSAWEEWQEEGWAAGCWHDLPSPVLKRGWGHSCPSQRTSHHQLICKEVNLKSTSLWVFAGFSF